MLSCGSRDKNLRCGDGLKTNKGVLKLNYLEELRHALPERKNMSQIEELMCFGRMLASVNRTQSKLINGPLLLLRFCMTWNS